MKQIHFVIDLAATAVLIFSATTTAVSVWFAWWNPEDFSDLPYRSYLWGVFDASPEHLVRWGVIASFFSLLFLADLWKLRSGRSLPPSTTPGSGSFPFFGCAWLVVQMYITNMCWSTLTQNGLDDGGGTLMSYGVQICTLWNSYDLNTENILIITMSVILVTVHNTVSLVSHLHAAFFQAKPKPA